MNLSLSCHAEENALIKYRTKLRVRDRKEIARRKLHMVVIRINAHDELVNSKPCTNCIKLMKEFGIRKVSYSTPQGMVTELVKNIVSQPSVGYRSIERAINILNELV